ncbi:MAG: hypothetical protein HW387_114 [Parachlamydiales bacterium]|nr:hypothetical protein [Parachlamydiales bacterium]
MSEHSSYPNPPIVEAIFDVQMELPQDVGIAELETFGKTVASDYPEKKTRRKFASKFEIKDEEPSAEAFNLGIAGILNWSPDHRQALQVRLDGFSFSRLKPYEKWDVHFTEFLKCLRLYCEHISPIQIKRVATRFINVIELPRENLNWGEYFINAARTPIPDAVATNFFDRVEFTFPSSSVKASVTHAMMQSNDPLKLPVVLDIETFVDMNNKPDLIMIEKLFQNLRETKNQIFQNSLTDKTKGLFK